MSDNINEQEVTTKNDFKLLKGRIIMAAIVIIGFIVGYNIMDIFLDLLLGGRMF